MCVLFHHSTKLYETPTVYEVFWQVLCSNKTQIYIKMKEYKTTQSETQYNLGESEW